MEKITLNVRDGEVKIPVVGKVIKKGTLKLLYRIVNGGRINYIYPTSFGGGTCDASAWTVEELKSAQPCSAVFWNSTLQAKAFEQIRKVSEFLVENTIV